MKKLLREKPSVVGLVSAGARVTMKRKSATTRMSPTTTTSRVVRFLAAEPRDAGLPRPDGGGDAAGVVSAFLISVMTSSRTRLRAHR